MTQMHTKVTLKRQNMHKNVNRNLVWTQLIRRVVCYN